jgi:hypothetical protein
VANEAVLPFDCAISRRLDVLAACRKWCVGGWMADHADGAWKAFAELRKSCMLYSSCWAGGRRYDAATKAAEGY